ncbi:MAG TPA: hypothetical protein VMN99_13355 [Anaerolineales bacterium]|nr:hypothetical protein [Anaerolineales bacterium]
MRTRWISLIFLLSLALGSCSAPLAATGQSPELPPSDPQAAPTEPVPEYPLQLDSTLEPTKMPSAPSVEKFVALSKKDLASRLGIEPDRITLVKTAEKLWLNAALGCPRPGVFYQPGRVPGFQIGLEVDGTEYIYNTDLNATVILCPELNPHVPNLNSGPTPGVPIR